MIFKVFKYIRSSITYKIFFDEELKKEEKKSLRLPQSFNCEPSINRWRSARRKFQESGRWRPRLKEVRR
jgi:hypothetical protein